MAILRGGNSKIGTRAMNWTFRRLKPELRTFLFAVVALCGMFSAMAQDGAPGEYEIKGAFLFNFAKFVEWPDAVLGKADPIRIGVLGRGSLLTDVEKTIQNKKIDEHPVVFENYAEILPARLPHILFIAGSDPRIVRRALADTAGAPALVVGEVENFCEMGGVINFRREGRKIRFEVNPKAAERRKLKLSSKLIGVAVRVVEPDKEP
jgi:hypothetical protein